MKKRTRLAALLLATPLFLLSCGHTDTPTITSDTPTSASATTEITVTEMTTASELTTTAPTPTVTPVKEEKMLPEPYIDIEFYEDGTIRDIREHVSCTMPAAANGRVENSTVTFAGKDYTVPHLHVEKAQGAVLLTYEYLVTEADVTQLMGGGFTVETFLVNGNSLAANSSEQCMTNAGQSGGFGLSIKHGKLGFGVYTDSSYKTASFPGKHDTKELTHLLGVYDPATGTVSLYMNGVPVNTVEANGVFRPAQQNCHPYIALGGDVGSGGTTELYATNTRIADFKLYPTALTAEDVTVAYETAVAKLTGGETAFELVYQPIEGIPKGTEDAVYKNVLNSFAEVYEPITSLKVSPTVWQWANGNLSAMADAEERPATVLLDLRTVNGTLHLSDTAGNDLGTAKDVMATLDGKIIPAFRLTDPTIAAQLTDFINRNHIGDCFVFSADGDLLRSVCNATTCARPVLDRTAVTVIDTAALFTEISYFGAKRVLLPADLLTQENVLAMHARSMTVFAMLANDADIADVHNAVFSAADGILTADSAAVLNYYRTFTETTIPKSTLIVAHRGDHAAYPDNTMRSFISGAESGANIIELDIWMTADGHLVLNHDAKTNGWSEVLDCKTSTRAQLEALTCTSQYAAEGDRLAFYEDVLEYFSKNHTDIVIYAEIKDSRTATADKVVQMTKEYGMLDRVLFLQGNLSFDQYIYNTYRVAVMRNSAPIYPRTDLSRALALSCIDLAELPTDYFTQWKDANEDLMRMLRHRGVAYGPWTSNTAADTDTHFFLGYANITSNTPHQSDQYVRFLKTETAADGTVTVRCIYYDGTVKDMTAEAEFVRLSGDVTYTEGKISGHGSYAFRLKTALPLRTDLSYWSYSLACTG